MYGHAYRIYQQSHLSCTSPIYRPRERIDEPLADNEVYRPKPVIMLIGCLNQGKPNAPAREGSCDERFPSGRSQATCDYYRSWLLQFIIALRIASTVHYP